MKVHPVDQGSVDWFRLRAGKVTASEMDRLITPLGKIRTGEGPKTFLAEKLAERWTGEPLPSGTAWDLEQGQILERYARPAFTLETGLETQSVGFVTDETGNIGCSPDGLIGDISGLELKCPHLETHIRYLLDGGIPPDYIAQVQGSMYVTGRNHWYFCSYRRKLPLLVLRIERDEKFHASLAEAIGDFLESLGEAWNILCEKNGGPPPERKPFVPSSDSDPRKELFQSIHDPDDVLP